MRCVRCPTAYHSACLTSTAIRRLDSIHKVYPLQLPPLLSVQIPGASDLLYQVEELSVVYVYKLLGSVISQNWEPEPWKSLSYSSYNTSSYGQNLLSVSADCVRRQKPS